MLVDLLIFLVVYLPIVLGLVLFIAIIPGQNSSRKKSNNNVNNNVNSNNNQQDTIIISKQNYDSADSYFNSIGNSINYTDLDIQEGSIDWNAGREMVQSCIYPANNPIDSILSSENIYELPINSGLENYIKELFKEWKWFQDRYSEQYSDVEKFFNNTTRIEYLREKMLYNTKLKNEKPKNNNLVIVRENKLKIKELSFDWSFEKHGIDYFHDKIKEINQNYPQASLIKIRMEIDLHYASKKDAELILDYLLNNLNDYETTVNIIHGYKKGTVLKNYVRELEHTKISKKITQDKNEGLTIIKLNSKEQHFQTDRFTKNEPGKYFTEEEEVIMNYEKEKLFKEMYPKVYVQKEILLNNLTDQGLNENHVKFYLSLKTKFDDLYDDEVFLRKVSGKKQPIKEEFKELIFDDFYFSKILILRGSKDRGLIRENSLVSFNDEKYISNSSEGNKIIIDFIKSKLNQILEGEKLKNEREEQILSELYDLEYRMKLFIPIE